MGVLIPYTHVCRDTWDAIPEANFVRIRHDDHYRDLLAAAWDAGDTFILVEHDVAPTREQIDALERCEGNWCVYGYGPGFWLPTFGCVKFGEKLIAGTAGVWENEWPWNYLDQHFTRYALDRGFRPCWHWPHVRHVATRGRVERTPEDHLADIQREIRFLRETCVAHGA